MEYRISDRMAGMKPSVIREILKQMGDPTLISFAGGNPAADSFPKEAIARFSAELLESDPVGMLQYSVSEGVPSTREAMKRFVSRRFHVVRDTDEVLVMSGSQQIIDFAAKCLVNEGDDVAVEDPAFHGAYNTLRSHGAKLVGVPMEDDGVDLTVLEHVLKTQSPRLFYCIPNFQNPTGKTMSYEKRIAVYELCAKYGVPILEDDPYGELRIAGEDLPPIKSFDEKGVVIYAASFSKILSPAMRLACCVCDKGLASRMVVAKQCCDVHTTVWSQRVCERILTETDIDAHIASLRELYRCKAHCMLDALDTLCPSLEHTVPDGGMFIWATLPVHLDMPAFVAKCLENKVAVIPGNVFFVDEAVPCQSVRLNFSAPAPENIEKGVAVMADVLRSL